MTTPRRIHLSVAIVAGLGIVAGAVNAGAATSRPADSLSGHVTSTQGRWRNDQGRLSIRLTPGRGGATRHLVMRLTGRTCAAHTACVDLRGKLPGTITARASAPDVGRSFSITARGQIAPLGTVRASGIVTGTGMIARGRVTLRLTLQGAHGSVAVMASSGLVPAFTSP
jgi:hypothetical protein